MDKFKTARLGREILDAAKKHCVLTDQVLYEFVGAAIEEKLKKEGYKID